MLRYVMCVHVVVTECIYCARDCIKFPGTMFAGTMMNSDFIAVYVAAVVGVTLHQ